MQYINPCFEDIPCVHGARQGSPCTGTKKCLVGKGFNGKCSNYQKFAGNSLLVSARVSLTKIAESAQHTLKVYNG
jgi:hypothetical protein